MTKVIKEGEFLIPVNEHNNTVAKHKVQLVDHEDDDSYMNRFELILEDVTRQSENTDARFSDFAYDNYDSADDMFEYLQDTDLETELEDWEIDYVIDIDETILISESIRDTANTILDDIQSEFSMTEQSNFNRFDIYYVKHDDFVYMNDVTMFDDIKLFFEQFAFKYLLNQFDRETREYFTDRQLEVSLKKKYSITLSSTERDILSQLRYKIEKANLIVNLSQNLIF